MQCDADMRALNIGPLSLFEQGPGPLAKQCFYRPHGPFPNCPGPPLPPPLPLPSRLSLSSISRGSTLGDGGWHHMSAPHICRRPRLCGESTRRTDGQTHARTHAQEGGPRFLGHRPAATVPSCSALLCRPRAWTARHSAVRLCGASGSPPASNPYCPSTFLLAVAIFEPISSRSPPPSALLPAPSSHRPPPTVHHP